MAAVCHDMRDATRGTAPPRGAHGVQVAQAGKRLSPGDPDRTLPKPLKLEPWDLIRFLWRGKMRVKATHLDLALGVTAEPDLTASTPRLQVHGIPFTDAPALRYILPADCN